MQTLCISQIQRTAFPRNWYFQIYIGAATVSPPYRSFKIPKKDGTWRTIEEPEEDRKEVLEVAGLFIYKQSILSSRLVLMVIFWAIGLIRISEIVNQRTSSYQAHTLLNVDMRDFFSPVWWSWIGICTQASLSLKWSRIVWSWLQTWPHTITDCQWVAPQARCLVIMLPSDWTMPCAWPGVRREILSLPGMWMIWHLAAGLYYR